MVREAGGVTWTYEGQDYSLKDDSILAANPLIAPAVAKRIHELQRDDVK